MVESLTARIPGYIVNWLDSLVEKGVYKSRSEAVRDFLRQYVLEQRAK